MKKMKQIAAIFGIVLLLALYLITFIGAITASPYSAALFKASIYCTIVIPIMIYVYIFVYRLLKKDFQDKLDLEDKNSKNNTKN